jgi:hypothetical protein
MKCPVRGVKRTLVAPAFRRKRARGRVSPARPLGTMSRSEDGVARDACSPVRAGAWSSSVDSLASRAQGNPSPPSAHDRYGDGGRRSARRSRVLEARPGASRVDGFGCPLVVRVAQAGATAGRIALLGCNEVGNPGLLCSPGRLGGLKGVMVPVCDRLEVRSPDGSGLRGTGAVACLPTTPPTGLRARDRRMAPSRRLPSGAPRPAIMDPNSGDESV